MFRRRYAELFDEGLLSSNREDLVDLARACFDQELAKRGLQYEQETDEERADISDDPDFGLVVAALSPLAYSAQMYYYSYC